MKVKNGFKYKRNGWNYISIKREPYETRYRAWNIIKRRNKKCLQQWNGIYTIRMD